MGGELNMNKKIDFKLMKKSWPKNVNKNTSFLMKQFLSEAYEKGLIQYSGDAKEEGLSPYWVSVEKLPEFTKLIIELMQDHCFPDWEG